MKKRFWLKIVIGIVVAVLVALAGFVVYLTVTEYRPDERKVAEHVYFQNKTSESVQKQMTVFSWNIGYAGLGASTDFFMDGGNNVNPTPEEVNENLTAVKKFISSQSADAWLLQEVDVNSARTGHINELESVFEVYPSSYALAFNYKCEFVPIPLPPIGKIESGIATFTDKTVKGSSFERIALPCPFSWPVSLANLKRCLLVTRLPVENSDKEVVLVNLHLEAYDDGEGKIAQTELLMNFLREEYKKGNYVIAGGDFNQVFPQTLEKYQLTEDSWVPGVLEEETLPQGFSYAFDSETPTCRLLNRPLDENTQKYVIDGFIVSPNVKVEKVETVDLNFANSDHNPVKLDISLLQ